MSVASGSLDVFFKGSPSAPHYNLQVEPASAGNVNAVMLEKESIEHL